MFGVPDWGLALLVCYPAVQLPVAYYLARHVELREGESLPAVRGYAFREREDSAADSTRVTPPTISTPAAGTDGLAVCRRCGRENRSGYRYCRHCVTRVA